MRVCVVVRGIAYDPCYRPPWADEQGGVDCDMSRATIRINVIDPLRAEGHEVSCVLATYEPGSADGRDRKQELQDLFAPVAASSFAPFAGSTQLQTAVRGLRLAQEQGPWDLVVMTRFDAHLHRTVRECVLGAARERPMRLWLPWREREDQWVRDGCVGDAVHIVPGAHLPALLRVLQDSRDHTCALHYIQRPLAEQLGEAALAFMTPGYYESGHLNPLYRMDRHPHGTLPRGRSPPLQAVVFYSEGPAVDGAHPTDQRPVVARLRSELSGRLSAVYLCPRMLHAVTELGGARAAEAEPPALTADRAVRHAALHAPCVDGDAGQQGLVYADLRAPEFSVAVEQPAACAELLLAMVASREGAQR